MAELSCLNKRAVYAHIFHKDRQAKFICQPVQRPAAKRVEQVFIGKLFCQVTHWCFIFNILFAQQRWQCIQSIDYLLCSRCAFQAGDFQGKQIGCCQRQNINAFELYGMTSLASRPIRLSALLNDRNRMRLMRIGMPQCGHGIFRSTGEGSQEDPGFFV